MAAPLREFHGSPWIIQILSTPSAAKRVGNPTDGSPWIVQILSTASADNQKGIPRTAVRGLFRSSLQQALTTRREFHGRQSVDYSDPLYSNAAKRVWNPTDGSPWIIQIVSTASATKRVGNSPDGSPWIIFRSFLKQAKIFVKTELFTRKAHCRSWDSQLVGSACSRKDLNNPRTAVRGIPTSFGSACSRKDLNNPRTAVRGIPN